MGLMDILFGPFERLGWLGGLIWPIILGIITGVAAWYWMVLGVGLLAAVFLVIHTLLTYGLLVFFFYIMWLRRPK